MADTVWWPWGKIRWSWSSRMVRAGGRSGNSARQSRRPGPPETTMTTRLKRSTNWVARWGAIGLLVITAVGCATGRAVSRGDDAARRGDWDAAVAYYRQALSEN